MPTSPPIIGIAGGIGSGKSTVARLLADLGCVVCDSDALGRAALRDETIKATLREWWGDDVFDVDGDVDRRAVAGIVFADPDERRRLEGLTHPWIEARRREQFAAAPASAPALVIDAPLLYEAGLDAECDAVIFVESERATRLERLLASRGWSEAETTRREDSQMPLDVKRSRADHIVQNDGDPDRLAERIRRTLDDIVRSAAAKDTPSRSHRVRCERPVDRAHEESDDR